jgi:hypothetical protein
MGSESERALNRRNPSTSLRGLSGLPKTGRDEGLAALFPTSVHPHSNPAESAALRSRKTDARNGLTGAFTPFWTVVEAQKQAVSRKRRVGRIAREANASGKARGYADVGTTVWKVGNE